MGAVGGGPLQAQPDTNEVDRLEALGAGLPGSPAFPSLAEAHRRAGRAEQALKVAEEGLRHRPEIVAGRVALCLALLDLGRVDEARGQLERVLQAVPQHALANEVQAALPEASVAADPLGGLDEAELETAFADAEAEPDEMLNANHVAEAALHAIEEGVPEGVLVPRSGAPFATETVAGLLEEQGHEEGAQAIRRALAADGGDAPAMDSGSRAQLISTLEHWLENLRGRTS